MKAIESRPHVRGRARRRAAGGAGRRPGRGARAGRGRLLQAGRARHARVAGGADHAQPRARGRRRSPTTTRWCARSRRATGWPCCRWRARAPSDYDLAVLVTLHDGCDYGWLARVRRTCSTAPTARRCGAQRSRRSRWRPTLRRGTMRPGFVAARARDPVVQPRAARRVRDVPRDDRGGGDRLQGRLHRDGRRRSVLRRLQRRRLRLHPEPLRCSASSTTRRRTRPSRWSRAIAIVMPAFNEEDAVADSIRSLLAVDYPAEKLEIVVVNDGSTDGTLREIHSVADGRPGRARDRLPGEPRQARRDGGRHPGHARGGDRVRRLRQLARARRAAPDRARLRGPARGGDRRPRRGAELARDLDHAHAGGALLRRFQGLQGGRVDLRRGHVLLRAASRPTGARRSPRSWSAGRTSASSAGPRPTATTARSPTSCCATGRCNYDETARSRDDRAGALPPVPAPAAALEALLDARVADRRALHLAQEPAREPVGLPRHRPAAARADRRGARDRLAAAGRAAPARR